jgi:hypothetical protein
MVTSIYVLNQPLHDMKKENKSASKLQLHRQAIARLSYNEQLAVQGGTAVITGTLACTTIVASGGDGGSFSKHENCTKVCLVNQMSTNCA